MSDDIRIIETTEIRQVTYYVNGIEHTDEIEVTETKHVRPDGTLAKLILRPMPIRIQSQTNTTGE